jgi:putative aldouronate transport system permease protein
VGSIQHHKKRFVWRRDDTELSILALPTTIWYVLFAYLPMFGILIAFIDFRLTSGGGFIRSLLNSDWVGFKNFHFLFSSTDIWLIVRNTLLYNLTFIVLGIVVPVTCAIMINQLWSRKLAKVFQTAMFLPHFLSWTIVTVIVWGFFSFDKGLLNHLLADTGAARVQWYQRADIWPFFLIFLGTWKSLGHSMIVYLATITGIDSTYYEAALIDGASKWQQVRYITLPCMKPVIILMFILAVGRIFYSDFGLFFLVPRDSNSLYNVVYTIDVFVFKQLKTATVGMASASAFTQSVIGCATILLANWIVRRVDAESAMI